MTGFGGSLRAKLIAACVLVEVAATALLVLGSARLLQRTLTEQATHQATQVVALLDQVIAAPMAQRDFATLQQSLDLVRNDQSINYLVLWDHREKLVATSGWDAQRPLPPRDDSVIDLDRADATLHLAIPVIVAGQQLGRLDLGLATAGLRKARTEFLIRSFLVAAVALAISIAVLAAISVAITRHLTRLARASQRVAEGDFDVQVPVRTNDEIGRLGTSFNSMASILKERMASLAESEAKQGLHLHEVREERSRLTTLLGAMRGGIMFVDVNGQVIYANSSFARIWAIPELETGQQLSEIVPILVRRVDPSFARYIEAMLQPDASELATNRELHTLDGRIIAQRTQQVSTSAVRSGCIWFHDDITLERQTQQRAHQAFHDPLTQLFNRRGLVESLQAAIARATAERSELALLFVDLDDFKHINDVGGHRTGDELLLSVARALSGQLRRGEVIARLGGDEFAVLCPGIGADGAGAIADRLVEAVASIRVATSEQQLRVGCSIGIATYPRDALNEEDLVACADTAMYQAKQGGKNIWSRYRSDPERLRAETARVNWGARIHRALRDQGFVLHFQSIHRATDLHLSHHEALLRMVDEQDSSNLVSPGAFVTHAERSGKILQIDRWVFENCILKLAETAPGVRIAANLSARSLEDASFPRFLRETLQRHDVDSRRLQIELTETSANGDLMAARQRIIALRSLGCGVHLDDFGSGFSSFAHLKLLDVDAIKIDGTFIRALQTDAINRMFVASMIDIAHNLKKITIAEHVEDEATLDTLRTLGIDLVQGFHLGRPSAQLVDSLARPRMRVVSELRRSAASDGG